ncbi:MAG: rhodanese [Verrucomicrobiae bacterium]|nr:rhodanese [Verrucomicrobiae bacterium]
MFPSEDSHEITVAETAAILADDTQAFRLVDCREEDEHAYCRIEQAELIPLSRFAEMASARLLPPTDESLPIIVYCHHGMRSMSATQFLRQKGLRQVWSMRGGIDAWSHEIDPKVRRY